MAPDTRATAGEKAAGTPPVVAEEGGPAVEAQVVPDIGIHTADETGPGVVPELVVVGEVGSGAVAGTGTRVKAEAGRMAEVKATGAPLVGTEDRVGAPGETRVMAEVGRKATGTPLATGTEERVRGTTGSPLAVGTEEVSRGLAEAATKKHAAADQGARAVVVAVQDGRQQMIDKVVETMPEAEEGQGARAAAVAAKDGKVGEAMTEAEEVQEARATTVSAQDRKVGEPMTEAEVDQGARAAAVAAQDGKVGESMTEAAAERFWMVPQHGVNSIALKTNDDQYFFVREDFVKPFRTIDAILEFGRGDDDMVFPLPIVDGRTLSIALEWQARVESGDSTELGPVEELEVKDFYNLMDAGEYLEHEELVKAACSAIAYRMCDKTTGQIRETASFVRCFPELYETIRHELASTWAKGGLKL